MPVRIERKENKISQSLKRENTTTTTTTKRKQINFYNLIESVAWQIMADLPITVKL